MFNRLSQILQNNQTFSVFKMDGFLTATISAPNLIHPRKWIKITNVEGLDLEILFDFYNQIYSSLRDGSYLPIVSKLGSRKYLNHWANGYMLGKDLWDPFILKSHQIEINKLLLDILVLLEDPVNLSDNWIDLLPKSCINIYRYWEKQSL